MARLKDEEKPAAATAETPKASIGDDGVYDLSTGKKLEPKMWYWLELFRKEGDNSKVLDVPINGYAYHIPRGVKVKVPDWVVAALNEMVIDTTRYDPTTGQKTPYKIRVENFTATPVV